MTNVDLGPRKTVFIMVIVVGCFAVLWPKVFYPMYAGNVNSFQPKPQDKSGGCCDVIWVNDVNAIKIMVDLCGNILKELRTSDPRVQLAFESGKLTNDIIEKCRSKVLSTCGVDIALFLKENVLLGRSYRQILDELRSTNSSLCLKYNFGVTPDALGVRHQLILDPKIENVRQERPAHLRPDMLHPALRERGRAIPPSGAAAIPSNAQQQQPRVVPGRPGPIPGMRPTIGGAGHVVPAPKQSSSTMGIVMPIYTIGIVIFFTYTLMKVRSNNNERSFSKYENQYTRNSSDTNNTETKHCDDSHISENLAIDVSTKLTKIRLKKYNHLEKLMWIQKNFKDYNLTMEDDDNKQLVLR